MMIRVIFGVGMDGGKQMVQGVFGAGIGDG